MQNKIFSLNLLEEVEPTIDKEAFLKDVEEICGRDGPVLKQALIDACMMTKHGSRVFPLKLKKYANDICDLKIPYSISCISLIRVMTYIECFFP